ncbi:unnamed protein product [Cochlearia groenlandica]
MAFLLKNFLFTSMVITLTLTILFTGLISSHRLLLQSTPATQPPALTFPPMPPIQNLPQPNGFPPMPTQIPTLPNPVQPTLIPSIPQVNFPIPTNFPFNLPFNIPNIPFLSTPPPSK